MNISYNWLKDYVNFDLSPEELSAALTSIGLETGGIEEVQTIKGGLNGLVIGKVLTCEDHPNSDHLHITTVDLGESEPVQIVCGAANVAAGQYVVVATLGTVLYSGEESFTIKKSKIRGVESFVMICAEDEIGIGTSHDGIIVLPGEVKPGTLAKDYYNIKSDYVLEVDITPNRIDAASHYGVARDLAAYLTQRGKDAGLHRPSVNDFAIDRKEGGIDVDVANHEACIRGNADLLGPDIVGLVVLLVHRDVQTILGNRHPLIAGQELPCPRDDLVLEVILEGEVAQHLKEGAVAGSDANALDIRGADALLAGGHAMTGRLLLCQKPLLHGSHPAVDQQQAGVVLGYQGEAVQTQMTDRKSTRLNSSHRT